MKIIEALKELPLLEKRITKNINLIHEYSSGISSETPIFGTEIKQKEKVQGLIQANMDLITRYERLKLQLHKTNTMTPVKINGETKTINEWITVKGKTGSFAAKTLGALTTLYGNGRFKEVGKIDTTNPPKVERYYNEEDKNKQIEALSNTYEAIDAALEIANATLDLSDL